MEQTRALNALEQYLVLARSAPTPSATADIIAQATSAPNTYVFAELLQQPKIQALRESPEHAKSLQLLEIFVWGTWADYQKNASSLPQLNPAQQQKLRLLSLLTLAASSSPTSSTLTYAHLTSALSLASTRELEALLTTAIYSNLITATLDPAHGVAVISSVSPLRDLSPASVPQLLTQLELWGGRCDSALAELDARIAEVKAGAAVREQRNAVLAKAVAKEREAVEAEEAEDDGGRRGKKRGFRGRMEGFLQNGGAASGGRGGHDDGDLMDVDQGGGGVGGSLRSGGSQKKRVVFGR